jgi:hypothetical protein
MAFTANKSFKICRGLWVEERKGAAVLKARASVKGKVHFTSMETTDFDRAERKARSWFARLDTDAPGGSREHITLHAAAAAMLKDIRKPVRREYHEKQWSAIKDFFIGMDVDAVDTPTLKRFVRERRQKVSEHTTHKSVITIRKTLQHAAEEGWIASLPVFPKLDRIEPNPRPWLDEDEWTHLQRVAEERIEAVAGNDRLLRQRRDMLDFCRMAVASYTRVDELRNIRVRDCKLQSITDKEMLAWFQEEARLDAQRQGSKVQRAFTHPAPQIEYLDMEVTGKRGTRQTKCRAALPIFQSVVKRKKLGPDDFLWADKPGAETPEHHRDAFTALLVAAKLHVKRINGKDVKRNFKSLRCTGLMLTVKAKKDRANLKALADNAGTSLAMLEQFYLKPLKVEMNPELVL